ncbi:unnamed protein product [Calypogeia fissa]
MMQLEAMTPQQLVMRMQLEAMIKQQIVMISRQMLKKIIHVQCQNLAHRSTLVCKHVAEFCPSNESIPRIWNILLRDNL